MPYLDNDSKYWGKSNMEKPENKKVGYLPGAYYYLSACDITIKFFNPLYICTIIKWTLMYRDE